MEMTDGWCVTLCGKETIFDDHSAWEERIFLCIDICMAHKKVLLYSPCKAVSCKAKHRTINDNDERIQKSAVARCKFEYCGSVTNEYPPYEKIRIRSGSLRNFRSI